MDSDGVIVDNDRDPPDVTDEEVLTWYKNMWTGIGFPSQGSLLEELTGVSSVTVSIMDLIMFDAQRQGRLSFYMVCPIASIR